MTRLPLILALLLALPAAGQTTRPVEPHEFVSCHGLAYARWAHPVVVAGGWKAWIEQRIEPERKAGCRRFIIHMPFGRSEGTQEYALDEMLRATEPALFDDFEAAWMEYIRDHDVEVIAYLGWMIDARTEGTAIRRFRASVAPLRRVGMALGLDAVVVFGADHWRYREVMRLREMGMRVYVEGIPAANMPHWHQFPVICTDANLASARRDGWGMDLKQAREVIVWTVVPQAGYSWLYGRPWLGPASERLLSEGLTPAGSFEQLQWERQQR